MNTKKERVFPPNVVGTAFTKSSTKTIQLGWKKLKNMPGEFQVHLTGEKSERSRESEGK